ADENHADRHQYAVEPVAVILSRSPDELRVAPGADAADAVHQLAVRPPFDPALPDLRGPDRVRDQSYGQAAKTGRVALHRHGGAHHRRARQYRADPELRPCRER